MRQAHPLGQAGSSRGIGQRNVVADLNLPGTAALAPSPYSSDRLWQPPLSSSSANDAKLYLWQLFQCLFGDGECFGDGDQQACSGIVQLMADFMGCIGGI